MPTTTRDHLAVIDCKLRSRLKVEASAPLDDRDIHYVIDILMMRTALLHDLLDGSTQAKIIATWERTILGLNVLDVELYSRDWKTLREILTSRSFLTSCQGGSADIDGFKRRLAGRIHYKWILNATCAIMEVRDDWFKKVNQWVVFDSRANLPSLDLSSACCEEYLDFEEDLKILEAGLPDRLDQVTRTILTRSARDLFGDFRVTDYPFRPRHGNGATAEVKRAESDPWHKNRHFAVDGEVINYLRYRCPDAEWTDCLFTPYRGLRRQSVLVCVPKSMTKNRTISKEPTTLQFLQQDLFAAFDDYFNNHPCHIDLHDQDRSRKLALKGSRDASYATIDLSSASDSVSLAVLEILFGDLPLYYPLIATRSREVLVENHDGSISKTIVTRKFAPMGSAVCFPVECMVFATICEAAIRLTAGRASHKNDYVVYGDDIVIRTEFAANCVSLLTLLGFVVNAGKSFGIPERHLDSVLSDDCLRFREACGIEAVNGVDVTPLRLSRRLVSLTQNDSDHQAGLGVGFVDLLNRSFLFGYSTLRQFVNWKLSSHRWYRACLRIARSEYTEFATAIAMARPSWVTVAVPFVIVDDATDTQWRAYNARFDRNLWRTSVLVEVAKPRKPRVPIEVHRAGIRGYRDVLDVIFPDGRPHDENDYFTWCYQVRCRPVDDSVFTIDDTGIVTIRPRDLKWSKTWVFVPRTPTLISVVHPKRGIRG